MKQNRLDGLLFDIGIFTNLSHDHLDYHKNFRDYLNAKLYLFQKLIKNDGIIITDSTIPEFKNLKKIADKRKIKLLTTHDINSDLELVSHHYSNNNQILEIKRKNKDKIFRLELNLIGKIQIKNLLMATNNKAIIPDWLQRKILKFYLFNFVEYITGNSVSPDKYLTSTNEYKGSVST